MRQLKEHELITLELILIEKIDSKLLVLRDSEWEEIKIFQYEMQKSKLLSIVNSDLDLAESLIESLSLSRYFREFIILLGLEDSDLYIASIAFKLEDKDYSFSYLADESTMEEWIVSDSRSYIVDELEWYVGDGIYDFDDYQMYIGFDESNLNFVKES